LHLKMYTILSKMCCYLANFCGIIRTYCGPKMCISLKVNYDQLLYNMIRQWHTLGINGLNPGSLRKHVISNSLIFGKMSVVGNNSE